jgi:hypothetical protein
MEYHADRFEDNSLLVFDDGQVLAVLPAHGDADTVTSHMGLTYGGLLVNAHLTLPSYLEVFDALLTHLKQTGVKHLRINAQPYVYHKHPADEVLAAMYFLDAPPVRTCALSVIPAWQERRYEERRRRGIEKAKRCHLFVARSDDYARMWEILAEVLPVDPVHTLGEIEMLAERFPHNIHLWGCYGGRDTLAGIVIYETEKVARCQYIATSRQGKAWGAGDLLMSYLIETYTAQGKAVDLGTSSSADGRTLERGILDYKEGWGARTVAYSHYLIDVAGYKPGRLLEALK